MLVVFWKSLWHWDIFSRAAVNLSARVRGVVARVELFVCVRNPQQCVNVPLGRTRYNHSCSQKKITLTLPFFFFFLEVFWWTRVLRQERLAVEALCSSGGYRRTLSLICTTTTSYFPHGKKKFLVWTSVSILTGPLRVFDLHTTSF